MIVRRHSPSLRYQMAVYIEQSRRSSLEVTKTTFFMRFSLRHAPQVRIAVGMATELDPFVEFQVMRQQHALTCCINNPRGTSQVTLELGTEKTIRMRFDKTDCTRGYGRLVRLKLGPSVLSQ